MKDCKCVKSDSEKEETPSLKLSSMFSDLFDYESLRLAELLAVQIAANQGLSKDQMDMLIDAKTRITELRKKYGIYEGEKTAEFLDRVTDTPLLNDMLMSIFNGTFAPDRRFVTFPNTTSHAYRAGKEVKEEPIDESQVTDTHSSYGMYEHSDLEESKKRFVEFVSDELVKTMGYEPEQAKLAVESSVPYNMLNEDPVYVWHYPAIHWANYIHELEASIPTLE